MGKRFWSLALSMALIGGVFSALPARAQEAKPLACGELFTDPAGDVDFENLDVLNGGIAANDDSTFTVEMRIKNLSTELPADGQGLTWYFLWKHADVTYFANATYSMWTDAITYNLGTLDGTSFSTTASTEGTFTEGENGAITVVVPYAEVGAPATGAVLTDTYADTRVRLGGPAGPGLVSAIDRAPDGTAFGTSYTLGSCGPVAGGPGKPSEPIEPPGKGDPPGKGKKKGCGKGKGKQKGACPGRKPPKPKPPVASCAPYTPGEEGAEAESSIITAAATEEKPVVVEYEAEMGGPSDPTGAGAFDLRSFLYHNVQVDSPTPDSGLYVKAEFTDSHDYDLALFLADGTEAASSGESQPEPGLGAGSPEGAWEGGSNYEMLKGIRTADCAGYTARVAGYLTSGGPVTISMWLGPVVADPAAPGGGELASDMFFNALGMRNPMTADSAQASGTPAATKGCTKGKGKKKGCKKPPVASCAPITPAQQGADKPTVVVTDSATAEAPIEQTVTLDMSTADFTPTDASYDYFNVQVDSAAASAGLYATFEFETRRDYDLYARWSDGSEAASSHGFNPAIEAEAPEPIPFDPSNQRGNHAGDSNADSENLVGLITPDCGGYTIETVNWLGEGGEFTVKLWLGEGTTEPHAPGEVPAA